MEMMTAGQFLVALFMSLAGLCAFIWGALSGQFYEVERAKLHAYRTEVDDDEH
jgi:cbb3-type cytochrome oxidase maturation protein